MWCFSDFIIGAPRSPNDFSQFLNSQLVIKMGSESLPPFFLWYFSRHLGSLHVIFTGSVGEITTCFRKEAALKSQDGYLPGEHRKQVRPSSI